MTKEIVTVSLGARAYDIHIGGNLLEAAGDLLMPILERPRSVIVTDENVFAAQGARLTDALNKSGIETDVITLAPGEATKSFAQLETLAQRLLELGIERNDVVIAFGGGVIGDLTGFASAVLRRGCRFAQIPTTLLAQVDSAVGGKTGINTPQGKNLVGAFHQPSIVIADQTSLETLPPRELRAGYAEVVKYGLINDLSFFEWLEEEHQQVLDGGDINARIHAVKKSCLAKAAIVADDELEKGSRALLNLGHTFGHAIEGVYGYNNAVLHGEAVAVGMVLALEYSARQGMCDAAEAQRVKTHLKKCGMPATLKDLPANDAMTPANLLAVMLQDKKVERGSLSLILARAIGDAFIAKDADTDDILSFLKESAA